MRLKSDIFVQAYLRSAQVAGAQAMLVRRGDADAGTIFIRINRLDGSADLFGPAPAGVDIDDGGRLFARCFASGPKAEADVDEYLRRQFSMDPDLWIIEVEDRSGRHFLDDWLIKS